MPHSPSCPTPCSLWGVTPSGCMGPEELGDSREALGFLHLGPSHTENSPFLEPLQCARLWALEMQQGTSRLSAAGELAL